VIRAAARDLGIDLRETIIIGHRVIGCDVAGNLYQWLGGVWVNLVPVGIKRARSKLEESKRRIALVERRKAKA
jgi:hypothetical protein